MAVTDLSTDSAQLAHAAVSSQNGARSSVATHNRRLSLPLNFHANLWSGNSNSSKTSVYAVESEERARGEYSNAFERSVSALQHLHASSPPRSSWSSKSPSYNQGHPYAKSTSANNSTFSQPVIVSTYSPTFSRSASRQPSSLRIKKSIYKMTKAELPPVEAFTFKGIMDSIQGNVAEDLERIAEICARSRYSLSNQYEVHMPPHGQGEAFLRPIGDEEMGRSSTAGRRGARKTKSKAFDTLETIYSSSRSSEEDKAKKKSAGEIGEEIRGKRARRATIHSTKIEENNTDADFEQSEVNGRGKSATPRTHKLKHSRSHSASFASIVMDTAQASRNDAGSHHGGSSSLVSEPLQPRTSNISERADLPIEPVLCPSPSATSSAFSSQPPMSMPRPRTAMPIDHPETRASVLANFSSWLPWHKADEVAAEPITGQTSGRKRAMSVAEGSLKKLLDAAEVDRKGKGVSREAG